MVGPDDLSPVRPVVVSAARRAPCRPTGSVRANSHVSAFTGGFAAGQEEWQTPAWSREIALSARTDHDGELDGYIIGYSRDAPLGFPKSPIAIKFFKLNGAERGT